jgi:hypothetical protein
LNWGAAVLLFPAPSWNFPAETSIVHAPAAAGVKVAVYTVLEVVLKLEIDPVFNVDMSNGVKPTAASLLVKVSESVESFEVNPSVPSAAVIVIVGPLAS